MDTLPNKMQPTWLTGALPLLRKRGISNAEILSAMGVEPRRFRAFRDGVEKPTSKEARGLARLLDVPTNALFRQEEIEWTSAAGSVVHPTLEEQVAQLAKQAGLLAENLIKDAVREKMIQDTTLTLFLWAVGNGFFSKGTGRCYGVNEPLPGTEDILNACIEHQKFSSSMIWRIERVDGELRECTDW